MELELMEIGISVAIILGVSVIIGIGASMLAALVLTSSKRESSTVKDLEVKDYTEL